MKDEKGLQEEIMELELVKAHLRDAAKILDSMSRREAKMMNIKDPEAFNRFMNAHTVHQKARQSISMAMFVLKEEIVELFWKKEFSDLEKPE